MQRLRFEHPEVKAVVLTGGLDKVFCAGANIQMLAGSTHGHKVNFCKFTNETRNAIEDATAHSGQTWIAAVNGTAAGGGYELALACDEILLVDDRLGGLAARGAAARRAARHRWPHPPRRQAPRPPRPGRRVRHPAEGVKGQQAVDWGLVDAVGAAQRVRRARAPSAHSARRRVRPPDGGTGVALDPARAESSATAALRARRRRDRRRLGAARSPCTGPRAATGDARRAVAPAPTRGSLAAPASSTTRCSSCGSTSPRSARGCCAPRATPTRAGGRGGPRRRTTGWRGGAPVLGPHAQAPRPVARTLVALIEPGSCFAGHARRAGPGRRPHVHARRHGGRRPTGRRRCG